MAMKSNDCLAVLGEGKHTPTTSLPIISPNDTAVEKEHSGECVKQDKLLT